MIAAPRLQTVKWWQTSVVDDLSWEHWPRDAPNPGSQLCGDFWWFWQIRVLLPSCPRVIKHPMCKNIKHPKMMIVWSWPLPCCCCCCCCCWCWWWWWWWWWLPPNGISGIPPLLWRQKRSSFCEGLEQRIHHGLVSENAATRQGRVGLGLKRHKPRGLNG